MTLAARPASALRLSRRSLLAAGAGAALGGCAPWTRRRKDADVVVVGAGLSGLFAAMWLTEAGMKTIVVEASDRIGGRLWTLDDLPGRPEAGGAQVGQTYARIRYAAQKLGVAIVDQPRRAREPRLLSLGGTLIPETDWAASPLNPLPDEFRSAAPDAALFAAAAPRNPFGAPDAWRTPGDADLSAEAFLQSLSFSAEARRIVDIALNANSLTTYSMANVWRTLQLFATDAALGPTGDIEGGSQRLPEKMATEIGDGVRLKTQVGGVTQDNGVVVRTSKGDLAADFCILALPFPALAGVALEPPLSGAQAEAVRNLPYTQILQLHLAAASPFWERDGLPAAMWTDGPLERVFTTRDAAGEIVALNAWINGEPARALSARADAELEAFARDELARLRPASAGEVRLLKAVRWTKDASYAGGAYMHWGPSEIARWSEAMGLPIGRVHFAGEHLSLLHTGMEGAMESGQAAAEAVIEAAS